MAHGRPLQGRYRCGARWVVFLLNQIVKDWKRIHSPAARNLDFVDTPASRQSKRACSALDFRSSVDFSKVSLRSAMVMFAGVKIAWIYRIPSTLVFSISIKSKSNRKSRIYPNDVSETANYANFLWYRCEARWFILLLRRGDFTRSWLGNKNVVWI